MTKPAHLRDALLKLLPSYSARRWMFPNEIRAKMPAQYARSIHPALAYMVGKGFAKRRKDERTGLFVYAKAKRNGAELRSL